MCLHKAQRSASSCPLYRSPASLWPSFFTGKLYHAARRVSPPPHVCSTLSLSWDSFTIVCVRGNPNLRGSLTGAPFNCSVQAAASWGENDSAQVSRSSLLPLCTAVIPSVRMLVLPCYSLQPAPSPVTQGLFIPGRLMCNKMSLRLQKKREKTDEPGDFWATFHHFSSTSYTDPTQWDTAELIRQGGRCGFDLRCLSDR